MTRFNAANARRRYQFTVADARVRLGRRTFAAADGSGERSVTTVTGYPIVWNQNSSDRGGYVVRLAKGSAVFDTPCLALDAHDFARPLGTTANGSLRVLAADDVGVPVEIDLPGTTVGRDVAENVGSKLLAGMSFSMANGFESYEEAGQDNGNAVILVTKFTVDEVSTVINPAFVNTVVAVADADDDDETPATDHAAVKAGRVRSAARLNTARLHMAAARHGYAVGRRH